MRHLFVSMLILLGSVTVCASEPEKIANLSSKVTLQNSNSYFTLSDGSSWKVVTFVKRWRSPSEWWHNMELIPQNYDCTPNNWSIGAEIEIYPKSADRTVNLMNASNTEDLRECTHLLVNSRKEQILFAIELHPAELLIHLFHDAHKDGYEQGYSEGVRYSQNNATEAYDTGYDAGRRVGYQEGYTQAQK